MKLRTKISLLTGTLLVLTLSGGTFVFISSSISTSRRALVDRGILVSRNLKEGLVLPLIYDDRSQVNRLLSEARHDAGADSIFVELNDGTRIGAGVSRADTSNPHNLLNGVDVSEGSDTVDFRIPITYVEKSTTTLAEEEAVERLVQKGVLTVSYSLEPLRAEIRGILLGAILVAIAAFFLLYLGMNYQIRRAIVDPVNELAVASRKIAGGDLSVSIRHGSTDEIGELAISFGEMTEQLRKYSTQMERLVAERTCELSRANKKIESIMSERENFVRAMSHDLASPLRNIIGLLDYAVEDSRAGLPLDLELLTTARDSARRSLEMVSQILDIAEIRTTHQEFEAVAIGDLVEELISDFSASITQKGIDLQFDGKKFPTLLCERNRMRQVFQNLIDNAIKYSSSERKPAVNIGFDEKEDSFVFFVRDNGVGILDRDKERVFLAFKRGTSAASLANPGRGVGLAAARAVVESYGGEIWFESIPGKGTTFFFTVAKSAVRREAATN